MWTSKSRDARSYATISTRPLTMLLAHPGWDKWREIGIRSSRVSWVYSLWSRAFFFPLDASKRWPGSRGSWRRTGNTGGTIISFSGSHGVMDKQCDVLFLLLHLKYFHMDLLSILCQYCAILRQMGFDRVSKTKNMFSLFAKISWAQFRYNLLCCSLKIVLLRFTVVSF